MIEFVREQVEKYIRWLEKLNEVFQKAISSENRNREISKTKSRTIHFGLAIAVVRDIEPANAPRRELEEWKNGVNQIGI